MMQKNFLDKIGIVYVAVKSFNMENTVLGVYSSVDSALVSVQDYLEITHPNTQWAWYGDRHVLENVDDEWNLVYLLPFQLDNDNWRRYEQT